MDRISLCIITKDEEEWLSQCITSVKPIIYEAIVVDTGSKDQTINLAKSLDAKVYNFEWDDDFSSARNFSISKASGDWILILDADECIAEEDLSKFSSLLMNSKVCYEFLQRHYTNDIRLSGFTPCATRKEGNEENKLEKNYRGYFESGLVRLFPNYPGLYYRGKVHELVEHTIWEQKEFSIQKSPFVIHHYGHTPEVRAKKNKHILYTPLGISKTRENPKDWKSFYELGVELTVKDQYSESVEAFNSSLKLNPGYVATWVSVGYVLCELQRYDEAITALNTALKLDPKYHEAYCNLGVVYLRLAKYDYAESCYHKAIKFCNHYINAYCNLGKLYALTGRISESVFIYKRAIEIVPTCSTAKTDLAAIYFSLKKTVKGTEYIAEALKDDPESEYVIEMCKRLKIELPFKDKNDDSSVNATIS